MAVRLTLTGRVYSEKFGLTELDLTHLIGNFETWEQDCVSGLIRVRSTYRDQKLAIHFFVRGRDFLVQHVEEVRG